MRAVAELDELPALDSPSLVVSMLEDDATIREAIRAGAIFSKLEVNSRAEAVARGRDACFGSG